MEDIYIKKIKSNINPNRDDISVRILNNEKTLEEYKKTVQTFMAQGNYMEAINTYKQMYMLTKDNLYRIYIADIVLKGFNNPRKSLELYKQLEPYMGNDLNFLYGISDVYFVLNDYYNQVLYLSKALNIQKGGGKCLNFQ